MTGETQPHEPPRPASRHWGIVGGGFLGMTLAHRLAVAGERVTLYEAADHLGGLADAWTLGPVTWDRHYHVTLLSDQHIRALLTELGLEQEMDWVETKTGFFTDGQLYSMSNTLEFLTFPPLGLLSKLRLGGTIFYASKLTNWRRLEQVPVADWLRRWSGSRAFERIWLPLLRAKLGENYRHTSAAFIWATIARMYAARRTGLKKEMFGYVRGGYARVLERMARQLAADGVEVACGHRVEAVTAQPGGSVRVNFTDQPTQTLDRVVLTCPSPVITRVCSQLTDDERSRHEGIRYQGILCASLLLKQPLSPYYVTNITDSWVPFTAVIEMSALVDRAQFGGHSLVYLPKYVPPDDPSFLLTDEELRETFMLALARMYPHFSRDDVLEFRVSRVRNVVALSTLNYSASLPPMQTSVPGVYAVNSAHIVNGTLNVNETVKLANDAARQFLMSGEDSDSADLSPQPAGDCVSAAVAGHA